MPDKAPSDEAVEAFFAEIDFPINATLEEIEDRFRKGLTAALPFLLEEEREARLKLEECLNVEREPWVKQVLDQTEPALRALDRKAEAAVARAEKAEAELERWRNGMEDSRA